MQSKKAAARRADRTWRFVKRKRRRNMSSSQHSPNPRYLHPPVSPHLHLQALQDMSAKGSAFLMMARFSAFRDNGFLKEYYALNAYEEETTL